MSRLTERRKRAQAQNLACVAVRPRCAEAHDFSRCIREKFRQPIAPAITYDVAVAGVIKVANLVPLKEITLSIAEHHPLERVGIHLAAQSALDDPLVYLRLKGKSRPVRRSRKEHGRHNQQ
jgi:hypothetical protein